MHPAGRHQQGQADRRDATEHDAEAAEASRHQTSPSSSSGPCTSYRLHPATTPTAASTEERRRRDPTEKAPAPRGTPAFKTQTTSQSQPRALSEVQARTSPSRPKKARW